MTSTGPGPPDGLVPGDEVEAQTRSAYGRMARRALDLVGQADGADGAEAAAWDREAPAEAPADGASDRQDLPRADGPLVERLQRAHQLPRSPLVHVPSSLPPPRPGPLAGLPVAVKDLIDVAGQPTRNGTPGGAWRDPVVSSGAWQRLAEAGAVCVGKTATHEMGWGATTPAVDHPHEAGRLAGGSSGGSAAAVALGLVPAALGSDTGGSVLIPAALSGVVGLRPTHGAVPLSGVTPLAPSQDTVGPLARDVALCLRLFGLLAARPAPPPVPRVSGLRIGVLATGPVEPGVATQVEAAVEALAASGARPVPVRIPETTWAPAVSLLVMLHASARLWAAAVAARPQDWGSQARALLTLGTRLDDTDADRAARAARAVRRAVAQCFTEHALAVLVLPSTAITAPLRDAQTVDVDGRAQPVSAALARFACLGAVTGAPALSVPCGRTAVGLPVGLQVLGPPGAEPLLGRVGAAVEQHWPAGGGT